MMGVSMVIYCASTARDTDFRLNQSWQIYLSIHFEEIIGNLPGFFLFEANKNANWYTLDLNYCNPDSKFEYSCKKIDRNTKLVGGWTNPFETYAPQIGSIFPNFWGENSKNISKTST